MTRVTIALKVLDEIRQNYRTILHAKNIQNGFKSGAIFWEQAQYTKRLQKGPFL